MMKYASFTMVLYFFVFKKCTLVLSGDCQESKDGSIQYEVSDELLVKESIITYKAKSKKINSSSTVHVNTSNRCLNSRQRHDLNRNIPSIPLKNDVEKVSALQQVLELIEESSSAHEDQNQHNNHGNNKVNMKKIVSNAAKRKLNDLPKTKKNLQHKTNGNIIADKKVRKKWARFLLMNAPINLKADSFLRLTLGTPNSNEKSVISNTQPKPKINTCFSTKKLDVSIKKQKFIYEKSDYDNGFRSSEQDLLSDIIIENKFELYFLHSCVKINNIHYYNKYLIKPNISVQRFNQNLDLENLKKFYFHGFFDSEKQNLEKNMSLINVSNFSETNENSYIFTHLYINFSEYLDLLSVMQELSDQYFTNDEERIKPFLLRNLQYEIVKIENCPKDSMTFYNLENLQTHVSTTNISEKHLDEMEHKELNYKHKKFDLNKKKETLAIKDDDKTETPIQEQLTVEYSNFINEKRVLTNQEVTKATKEANDNILEKVILPTGLNIDNEEEFIDLLCKIKKTIFMNKYDTDTDRKVNLFLEMPELIFYMSWRFKNYLSNGLEALTSEEKKLIDDVLSFFDPAVAKQSYINIFNSIEALRNYINKSLNEAQKTAYEQKFYYSVAIQSLKPNGNFKSVFEYNVDYIFLLLSFTLESSDASKFFKKYLQNGIKSVKTPKLFLIKFLLRRKESAYAIILTLNSVMSFLKKIHQQCQIHDLGKSILYPFRTKILVFSQCGTCRNCCITYSSIYNIVQYFWKEIFAIINPN